MKCFFLLFWVTLLIRGNTLVTAQESANLFDKKSTEKFAEYLMISKQYEFATIEYERLFFMAGSNDTVRYNLLRSYRLAGNPVVAIQRYQSIFPDNQPPPVIAREICKSYLTNKDYPGLQRYINSCSTVSPYDNASFNLGMTFLTKGPHQSATVLQQYPVLLDSRYSSLINSSIMVKTKKPWLAAGLSTIAPGLGKAYAGRWKDGAFSAIIIGTLSWRTYRFFEKKGASSYAGWLFGSVTAGFYLGNIWGSYRAVKLKNYNIKHQYEHEMVNYLLDE